MRSVMFFVFLSGCSIVTGTEHDVPSGRGADSGISILDASAPDAGPLELDASVDVVSADAGREEDVAPVGEDTGAIEDAGTDADASVVDDAGDASAPDAGPDTAEPDAGEMCPARTLPGPDDAVLASCTPSFERCVSLSSGRSEIAACLGTESAACNTCVTDAAYECASSDACGALVGAFDCCVEAACPTWEADCVDGASRGPCAAESDAVIDCVVTQVDEGLCSFADSRCIDPTCAPRVPAAPDRSLLRTCSTAYAPCVDAARTQAEADACTARESRSCALCASGMVYRCASSAGCDIQVGAIDCCVAAACPAGDAACRDRAATGACATQYTAFAACTRDRLADGTCLYVDGDCVR